MERLILSASTMLIALLTLTLTITQSCKKTNPQPNDPSNLAVLPVEVQGGLENGVYSGNIVMYQGDSLTESFPYTPWIGAEILGNQITQQSYIVSGNEVPSVTQFYEINTVFNSEVLTLYTMTNGTRVDIADYMVVQNSGNYMLLADMQLGVLPDTSSYWSGLELEKQ